MTLNLKQHLKDLISAPGVSAYEDPVREIIAKAWKPYADQFLTTNLGSLCAFQFGTGDAPRPLVMIDAHMDAIGMMVTGVEDGFLRFTQIGGVDPRILPGQMVTVHGTLAGRHDLPGMVVMPAPFLLPPEAGSGPLDMKYLLVDLGLRPEEVARLVRVGDVISFAQQPMELDGETLAGHTLDNRASVAALTVCLETLSRQQHLWDVVAVAAAQEEVGGIGAATDPVKLKPTFAIVIDVTFASGPGSNGWRCSELGKGLPLTWGINDHPALYRALVNTAEEYDIPISREPAPSGSGTDAFDLQVVEGGIPVVEINIPLRYMHTPVEIVALKDIRRAGRLMAAFISDLPLDFMTTIQWE